jgi:predicted nucleic acid-binding protein
VVIVLDASVAAKLFIAESDSDEAAALLGREHVVVAPDLVLIEVANALHKAWRRGVVEDVHMDRALRRLPTLFGKLYPTAELVADAAVISRILRHPVPDCVYVALNWRTGAPVVTADAELVRATEAVPAWSGGAVLLKDFVATP